MMLNGKVVLITGASRGIGRSIALSMAEHGAKVVINYLQSGNEASELAENIRSQYGTEAIAYRADVADEVAVGDMVEKIKQEMGEVDILINNAGALPQPQYWQEITKAVWDRTLDVNLYGPLNCIRAVVPGMKSRGGRIINISSTYGIMGSQFVPAYAISKAGLITLTTSLARDLAPNVTVNAIAPGNIDTDMTASAGEAFIAQTIAQTPLKRLGAPSDVANAALYLCSSMGDFITGQVLIVDGGHMLR